MLAAIVGVVASLAAWGFLEKLVKAGLGPTPLVIVGVVVAYMVTLVLAGPPKPEPAGG